MTLLARAPRVLVLWDVDHTLIESRGAGRVIYERAFLAATGKALEELASLAGRTELDIMADTLRLNDIEPTPDMVARLADALVDGYEGARDELRTAGRALPGALEVLAHCAAEPAIQQSVLTGNLREVARVKLEVFGLDRYVDFDSGAYGGDDPVRAKLVAIAQERALDRTGVAFGEDSTVLIGDTANDVHAGLTAGVHVIGAATGKTTAEELRVAGARHVVHNLRDCRNLLDRLVHKPQTGP